MKTMKRMKILLVAGTILIAGTIFFSCQKEQNTLPVNDQGILSNKSVITCVETFSASNAIVVFPQNSFGVSVTAWNDLDYTYFKITRASGVMTVRYASPGLEVTQTTGPTILEAGTTVTQPVPNPSGWLCGAQVTISFYVSGLGGGPNNKFQTGIITYDLRGLCTTTSLTTDNESPCVDEDLVTLTATVTATSTVNAGTVTIMEGNNVMNSSAGNTVSYSYTPVAVGTRTFTAVYAGAGGFCSSGSGPVDVTAEECGCDESFTYETTDNLTVTFTYISPEDLTDATFEFTCPQILSYTGGPISGVNNVKNPTVLVWQGDVTACVPVVFNITFVPDCKKNNPNIWTDFKVNTYSKKGALGNIVYTGCGGN